MPPKDIAGSPNAVEDLKYKIRIQYQRLLDSSVPHRGLRWAIFAILSILYVARVVTFKGFYVITYGLCIHLLYLLLMLITPNHDMDDATDEAQLPTTNSDGEFRPFVPKVQEFVVWKSMMKVIVICLFLTMFWFLDIPVYWPILVLYFLLLFATQMGSRIKHMAKHHYVPWNAGKPKFVPKPV